MNEDRFDRTAGLAWLVIALVGVALWFVIVWAVMSVATYFTGG